MQVKELINEGLKREFEITLLAGDINKKIEKRLKQVAKTVKMPGFRPGKVPLSVVRKKHGKQILGEILENTVADSSQAVMDERELHPALQPKIEVSSFDPEKEGSDLVYNLSFEIYPVVPEIDLTKIKVNKYVVDVTEKEVKEAMDKLKKSQKNFAPLKKARAAKKGDAVVIDFEGKVDGVAFEGGTAKDFQLELGSGQFIPGFEEQLIGAKKGENCVVKVAFPVDYGSKEVAGKDSEFGVEIKDILQPEDTEINDDFASKLGFENLGKLKEAIGEQVEKDFDVIVRTNLKKELFDALDEKHKFPVPEGMVDMETNSINEGVKREEGSNKEKNAKDDKKQQQEYKKIAQRRVRLGIVLADIGRKNAMNVSEDEVRKAVFEQARSYPGQEQKVIDFYQQNKEALEQLKGPILEDKVVDFVLSKVKTTDKKIGVDELLKISESEE